LSAQRSCLSPTITSEKSPSPGSTNTVVQNFGACPYSPHSGLPVSKASICCSIHGYNNHRHYDLVLSLTPATAGILPTREQVPVHCQICPSALHQKRIPFACPVLNFFFVSSMAASAGSHFFFAIIEKDAAFSSPSQVAQPIAGLVWISVRGQDEECGNLLSLSLFSLSLVGAWCGL